MGTGMADSVLGVVGREADGPVLVFALVVVVVVVLPPGACDE